MRIRIDLKIFLLLIIFYFTKQIEIYTSMIIFAIIHELGHLIVGILLKMKPEKIELTPMGLAISFRINIEEINKKIKRGNKFTIKKIIVATAGPLINLIIIIFILAFKIKSSDTAIYANLLLIIFNLLPISPLDGGRILNGILELSLGRNKARKYISDISIITTIILTAITSILILRYHNIAIILTILYLWIIMINEIKINEKKEKIYKKIKENICNIE